MSNFSDIVNLTNIRRQAINMFNNLDLLTEFNFVEKESNLDDIKRLNKMCIDNTLEIIQNIFPEIDNLLESTFKNVILSKINNIDIKLIDENRYSILNRKTKMNSNNHTGTEYIRFKFGNEVILLTIPLSYNKSYINRNITSKLWACRTSEEIKNELLQLLLYTNSPVVFLSISTSYKNYLKSRSILPRDTSFMINHKEISDQMIIDINNQLYNK